VIRPATREDAPAVAAINHRGWTVAYAPFVDAALLPTNEDPEAWAERLEHPDYRTLVADRDGTVCGFVSFGPTEPIDDEPDRTGIILALYVDADAQGQGMGGALLDAALDGLRAQGMRQAVLWTFVDNAPARAFYERRGWTPEPESTEPHGWAKALELRYRTSL
jgi:ribosomal protein S18 acetylase RimI-like enzyme